MCLSAVLLTAGSLEARSNRDNIGTKNMISQNDIQLLLPTASIRNMATRKEFVF